MNTKISPQRIIMYAVIAVLAIAALVLFGSSRYNLARTAVVPTQGIATNDSIEVDSPTDITLTRQMEKPFNTDVLRSSNYERIDRTLFETGRLPVTAPPQRGKLNLFSL